MEYAAATTAAASVSPGTLNYGYVAPNATKTLVLTLHNNGNGTVTNIAVTVTGDPNAANGNAPANFVRSGGTCGATLTTGAATCTIGIQYTAPATVLGIETGRS